MWNTHKELIKYICIKKNVKPLKIVKFGCTDVCEKDGRKFSLNCPKMLKNKPENRAKMVVNKPENIMFLIVQIRSRVDGRCSALEHTVVINV